MNLGDARAAKDDFLQNAIDNCTRTLKSVGIFSLFVNLLMLTGPFFMLQVYDRVLASRSVPTLVALCLLVAMLYTFMAALDFVRGRILGRTAVRLDETLTPRIVDAVLFHSANRTPNVGSQPVRDMDTVRNFLSGPAPLALFDAPWVPVYIVVVLMLHTWLGLLALAGAVILFVLMIINEQTTRGPMERLAGQSAHAHTTTEELRRNAEIIRALGMSATMQRRWMIGHNAVLSEGLAVTDRNGGLTAITKSIRLLLQSAILALGAYLAVNQEITPGVMITASIIFARALAPVEQSISQWRNVLGARKAWARLKTVLRETPPPVAPTELPEPRGRIAADNITFMVKGKDAPILQGVSFELEPGEALGVLGPTGAGKSTFAKILIGALTPQRGRVQIDGAPLDQWDGERLGKHIGYLTQESELFTGTVAENISRFDENAKAADIIDAARMAELHQFILELPKGYDTPVGDQGVSLSGGQRQRIGLARAIYRTPAIVILDEPNSNLDATGEAAVVAAIMRLKERGSTVIVIAHRPSAIEAVDKILFVKDGRQVAFGPRDAVLARILKRPDGPDGGPGTPPTPGSES